MDPTGGAQIGPKRRAGPCTGIAVHLTSALSIIIARPLVPAVADGGIARRAPPIALPLISISREPRAARRRVLRDQGRAGTCVGMVGDLHSLPPSLARDHTDDGETIIGRGTVPVPFMAAPQGRIEGVRMPRALSPPCVGTAGRLRRWGPSSRRCRLVDVGLNPPPEGLELLT
jgi:hypothetical protein